MTHHGASTFTGTRVERRWRGTIVGMRTIGVVLLTVLSLGACGSVLEIPDASTGDDVIDAIEIDAAVTPTLTAIEPAGGIVTTEVTLTGANFGATEGASTVSFGTAEAGIVSWSDDKIVARVPDILPASFDVTVTTSNGTTAAHPFRVRLPPMVYLNNGALDSTAGANTVTALSFNPETGELTQVGGPISTGTTESGWGGCATSAAVHEGSRQLFASGGTAVAIFDIHPVTGALTPVVGSPFVSGGSTAWGVRSNRAGTRLFVAHATGGIGVLDISGAGAVPIVGSPFAVDNVHGLALSQNEMFLYANSESAVFHGLSVAGNGALAPLVGSPFAQSGGFSFGDMRPGVDHLYIPGGSSLASFAINPATGAPTAIAGSPFPITSPAGTPHYPAFTPDGSRLYIGTHGDGVLQGYSLDASGIPTALSGSPWTFTPSGVNATTCVALSRDGRYLISNAEGSKQVSVFSLAVDGVPTLVTGSPFTQTTPSEDASGLALTF